MLRSALEITRRELGLLETAGFSSRQNDKPEWFGRLNRAGLLVENLMKVWSTLRSRLSNLGRYLKATEFGVLWYNENQERKGRAGEILLNSN
jgi:hypothetical protein